MSRFALGVIAVITLIILLIAYELYFNSGLRSPSIDLSALPSSVGIASTYLTKYNHTLFPGVYESTTAGNYLCVYTDAVSTTMYYYGVLVNAANALAALTTVSNDHTTSPSLFNGIVCFNPDKNTTVSASMLKMLKPYAGIVAGTNVPKTGSLPAGSCGTSATGPTKVTGNSIIF